MRTTRTNLLRPFLTVLMVCGGVSCGLSEDPRDDTLKHEYLRISDPAFEEYCLQVADVNRDGRISRYEARQMRHIACPDRGVESLWEIGEFINITSLDCSGNAITGLRLDNCTRLRHVDCSGNRLTELSVEDLHVLVEMRCGGNLLEGLDLHTNASLRYLDCRDNGLRNLNVAECAPRMEAVIATGNPLEVFYKSKAQTIDNLQLDDHSVVVEQ